MHDFARARDAEIAATSFVTLLIAGSLLYQFVSPGWQAALRVGGSMTALLIGFAVLYRAGTAALMLPILPAALWISWLPALDYWATPTEYMIYLGGGVPLWGKGWVQTAVLVGIIALTYLAWRRWNAKRYEMPYNPWGGYE